jgi:hypothetical protein
VLGQLEFVDLVGEELMNAVFDGLLYFPSAQQA